MGRSVLIGMLLFSASALAQQGQLAQSDSATGVHLQAEVHRQNRITVGPAGLLVGFIATEYERGLTDHLSIAIGPQLQFGAGVLSALGVNAFGFGSTLALRVFPMQSAHAPEGFWIGPESYASLSAVGGGSVASASLGGGLLGTLGYTFITPSGFTGSFGGGLGYGYGAVSTSDGQTTASAAAWGPKLSIHFQLGYAF